MASCNINSLLTDGSVLFSYTPQQVDALQTLLLYRIAVDSGASLPSCAAMIAAASAQFSQIDPAQLDSILVRMLVGVQTGTVPPPTAYDSTGIEQLQVAKANVLCQILNGDTTTDVRPWVTMPGYLAQYNSTFILQVLITVLLLRIANAGGGPYTFAGLLASDDCFQCTCDPIISKRVQVYLSGFLDGGGGCVPPEQPSAVSFTGGEELFGVSWTSVTNPTLDFLVEWSESAGPPFSYSQSVAANLRSLSNVPVGAGSYFGRVTARNAVDCVTVGTPDNVPFEVTAPFSPEDIAGLSFWLDASDSTTLVLSGANVTSWTDKAQSFVLNNGGGLALASPQYDASDPFGKPVVTFTSGSGQALISAQGDNINAAAPYTVFFAGYCNDPDSAFQSLVGVWDFSNGSLEHLFYFGASSATNITEFDNLGGGDTRTDDGAYSADTRFQAASVADIADPQTFYVNGVAQSLQSSVIPVSGWSVAASQILLGMEAGDGTSSNFFDGGVYEIIIYNSALSTSDREAVEAYLTAKWLS